MKLYENLLNAAREEPDAIALEFMGMQFPYFLVAHDARRVAAGLVALGLKPGDSVGCMLPNIPQFVAVYYGTLMAGCVFVPMNVMLLGPEVEYVVRDSNIKALVTYEMFAEPAAAGISKLDNPPHLFIVGTNTQGHKSYAELMGDGESFIPVDVDTNLPVMRLYTSGTTGKPKGAEITNANVIANLEMFESILPHDKGDKALCVLPLFHCFALNGVLNASVRHRTAVVLHPRFELETAFKSLAEDNIASFAGVPTMFFYLLKHPEMGKAKFPKLRYCISGGAAMPVEVMNQFEATTGVPIYEGFGLTETTVSVCINRPDHRKIGSIGQPFEGVEMKIFDEADQELANGEVGEVVIRGPNVMRGYLNKPEETAEALRNGWFHTGDLGYRDDEGFFFIVDRKKDMIIKGGFNIYPREIEEVIYQLPQVAEAAVIGAFDEIKGEHIVALVCCKPNQELTREALCAHLESQLAKYKLPQEYIFRAELPKGPTGKILKRELRNEWAQWNRDRVHGHGQAHETATA
ncbi:MAG: long-chain fatty acid--CoA ligase [Pirellulales bacterium]|nr:long-chain fatty acid--CoA ligase [Pirellulales bacterium]